ncbi:MAG: VOC family protein [Galactobacter sp.]|uniref:VOC family protein n=1 Tax=Galactobacter sp. TaxID=2676125 RepID=UPI0025C415D9|nr:VOC family protein [Galactobacter sp.]
MTAITDPNPTRPADDRLDANSVMGAVTLHVADLDAMIRYYHEGVGLDVMAQEGDSAILGHHGVPSMVLQHNAGLRHAAAGSAGLYHTAILFSSPADLASAVYSVARHYPHSFTGVGDHTVSQAFYFDDPEGNGVELYMDRPSETWTWHGGQVDMGTTWFDPNQFIQDHITEAGLSAPQMDGTSTAVGHVHLKVGDGNVARDFYEGVVGFDVTAAMGSQAVFFSVGGYHHHLAANTWDSRGALVRTPSLGLGEIDLSLPNDDALGSLRQRLSFRGINTQDDGRTLTFEDPWANQLRVSVKDA